MDRFANSGDAVWRRAIDRAADAMWIADASGVRYVNDAGCQLLGLARSAILGRSSETLLAESAEDTGGQNTGDGPVRTFGHVLQPSGGLIAVELQRATIEPGCHLVTAREMTSWVDAHQAIRTSEEQLRKLFDAANDAIYTHDLDGNFTYINRTGERMTGYSQRELLTMSAGDLIAPEYHDLAQRMVDDQLAGKPAETHELIMVTKDGRRLPIEISNWVLQDDGQASGIQGIARDMTERHASDAALLQTQQEAESLATAARELTLSLDRDAVLTSIAHQARAVMQSGAAWLGVRRPDGSFRVEIEAGLNQGHFLGLNMQVTEGLIGEVVSSGQARVNHHPATDPNYPPGLRAVMLSEGITGLVMAPIFLNDEIQALLITGRRDAVSYTEAETELLTRLADLAAPALRNAFLYAAVDEANRDLEEALDHSQRMAEAAQEAAALKSEFLATMSHEIRTPLSGIIGMLEMLSTTELAPREAEYVHVARNSSEVLLDLISNILDFSKIEAGSMTLETIEFDPRDPVESAAQVLAARAQAKGLLLSTFVDPALGAAIHGDPVRLRQVLLNLVGNAVKFTDSGSVEVRAALDPSGTLVKYTVRDTGIGLSPVARARLFQPFTQADGSTTRKYGGTGLGLAISKSLVELMGGEIGVESTEGEGATFWFTTSMRKGAADARDWRLPTGTRALIIEDRDPLLEVLEHYLGLWGAETVTYDDPGVGLAALRAAAQGGQPYGLVLADAAMSWHGTSLISAVRGDPSTSDTALVLMGTDVPREASGAKEQGIITYLPLPITHAALFESVLATTSESVWPRFSEPQADEPVPEDARNPEAAPTSGTAAGRVPVLLVEDNPVNQRVATVQLERLGLDVTVAGSGRTAVELFQPDRFAFILMDCQMPEMDGFEATHAIRTIEGTTNRRTPIIAMTANAQAGDREACLAAGMDDYLAKPVKLQQLEAAITRWLPEGNPTRDGAEPPRLPPPNDESNDPANALELLNQSTLSALLSLGGEEDTELVAELVDLFAQEAPSLVSSMREAASRGDSDALRRSAHSLKGSSSNLGATALASRAYEVEQRARANETDGVETTIEEIAALSARVVAALQTWVKAA